MPNPAAKGGLSVSEDQWSRWLLSERYAGSSAAEIAAAGQLIDEIRVRLMQLSGLGPGQVVLELGCGGGEFLPQLLQTVGPTGSVIALDVSRPLLERAASAMAGHPLHQRLAFVQGDMSHLPVPAGRIDALVARSVLQYAEGQLPAVAAEIARVLRPGGRLAAFELLHGEGEPSLPPGRRTGLGQARRRWHNLPYALTLRQLRGAFAATDFCPFRIDAGLGFWREPAEAEDYIRSLDVLPRPGCPPLATVLGEPDVLRAAVQRAGCVEEQGAWCYISGTRTDLT